MRWCWSLRGGSRHNPRCERRLCWCLQIADGLDFELPSDISDDEEIDEDMAFTEKEKKQFAGMFGNDGAGGSGDEGDDDAGEDLVREDSDASDGADFDADVRRVPPSKRTQCLICPPLMTKVALVPSGGCWTANVARHQWPYLIRSIMSRQVQVL